ncbi:shieldin complex subunit 1 [Aquarana catesbeiana]|uniref:shieldin complex subunit 1 n=1 Tax=Aquarana catesbeiana TaxID=8400 RepID=UPI003CC9272E
MPAAAIFDVGNVHFAFSRYQFPFASLFRALNVFLRRMEPSGAAASQSSQCSGVLDLSCTYDVSKSLLQPEPATGTLEEDSSCALTSASPASSLNFTGYRTSDCEDSEKMRPEDDERLSALSPSSSSYIVREQRSSTITSSSRQETNEDIDEAQLRANLDAFYELSSLPGDDEFSHQLTEKILELKQKNHLYALRSFQMGKIILRQEGTNVLQSSDNVFSSTGETLNIKPVAGLSDDVIRFLKDRNSTKKGP